MSKLTTLFFMALLALPQLAAAQGNGGVRGGGAVLCEDFFGIQKLELLDLFEARRFGLVVPPSAKTVPEQVTDALTRLAEVDVSFGREAARAHTDNQAIRRDPPPRMTLAPPNDLDLEFIPQGCQILAVAKYMPRYENGRDVLFVDPANYARLSTSTDRAALEVHEAVYKVLRDRHDSRIKDSRWARILTALLFSDTATGEIEPWTSDAPVRNPQWIKCFPDMPSGSRGCEAPRGSARRVETRAQGEPIGYTGTGLLVVDGEEGYQFVDQGGRIVSEVPQDESPRTDAETLRDGTVAIGDTRSVLFFSSRGRLISRYDTRAAHRLGVAALASHATENAVWVFPHWQERSTELLKIGSDGRLLATIDLEQAGLGRADVNDEGNLHRLADGTIVFRLSQNGDGWNWGALSPSGVPRLVSNPAPRVRLFDPISTTEVFAAAELSRVMILKASDFTPIVSQVLEAPAGEEYRIGATRVLGNGLYAVGFAVHSSSSSRVTGAAVLLKREGSSLRILAQVKTGNPVQELLRSGDKGFLALEGTEFSPDRVHFIDASGRRKKTFEDVRGVTQINDGTVAVLALGDGTIGFHDPSGSRLSSFSREERDCFPEDGFLAGHKLQAAFGPGCESMYLFNFRP
jgi:hypothetical protein